MRAHALHDPFWQSITIRYASDEVAVTVVNLAGYAEDVRSGNVVGQALIEDVRDHVAFLRTYA